MERVRESRIQRTLSGGIRMTKEEYINTVVEQIRCERIRDDISMEMEHHIDDQTDAYIEEGMEREEAMKKAVLDMGDPVIAGVSLDRVHRPRMAWNVLIVIGIMSIVSILLQYVICKQTGVEDMNFYLRKQSISVLIGLGLMFGVYFIDYSMIGTFGRTIGGIFLMLLYLTVFFIGTKINGVSAWLSIGGLHISMKAMLYLYAPIYGAILYHYRKKGYGALLLSLVWIVLPVFASIFMPSLNHAISLCLILVMMLSVALVKDWFLVNKKVVLSVLWGFMILIPIAGGIIITQNNQTLFHDYQAERIHLFFHPDTAGDTYVINQVRDMVGSSKFIGGCETTSSTSTLININSDYILTYIMSYYGILVALLLVGFIGFLIVKMFKISRKQKNQLGMMMGYGCGFVYSVQLVIYFLWNLGLWPTGEGYLPLLSYGGSGLVVSYLLLGILLSIYRYQNIMPTHKKKKKLVIEIH